MQGLEVDNERSSTQEATPLDVNQVVKNLWERAKEYRVLVIALFLNIYIAVFLVEEIGEALASSIMTALCAWDVYLLVTECIIPVERSMENESKFTTRVSKRVDRFFSRGQAMPSVSFLVNAIYAVSVLVVGITCFCGTRFLVVGLGYGERADTTTRYLPNNDDGAPNMMNTTQYFIDSNIKTIKIPKELKPWAFIGEEGWSGYGPEGNHRERMSDEIASTQKGSFLDLGDTAYFRATKQGGDQEENVDDNSRGSEILWKRGPESDGKRSTSFPSIGNPNYFTLIDAEEESPSSRFCFLGRSHQHVAVYCSPEQRGGSLFRTAELPLNSHVEAYGGLVPTVGFDGKLWIRCNWYGPDGNEHHAVVYAVDFETMEYSISILKTYSNAEVFREVYDDNWDAWPQRIPLVALGFAAAVASLYVLGRRGIPSGSATLCLGIKVALGFLLIEMWDNLLFFLLNVANIVWVVVATRSLVLSSAPNLWCCSVLGNSSDGASGLHRDMLLWGLYGGLAVLVIPLEEAIEESGQVLLCLGLCVVIGFILNHPVCQALGWTSGMAIIFIALFTTWSTMEMLWTLVIGGILSWGLGTLGYMLALHRTYLVVLFRNWSGLVQSPIRQMFSSNSRQPRQQRQDDEELPLRREPS